jgi:tricorn protease
MRSLRLFASLILALGFAFGASAQDETLLLREPTVSQSHVAFAYGGDLWVTPRAGGEARRLTSFPGVESTPHFSPDGQTVAFTGQYDGNTDVYTVPLEGGEPTRHTWHPGADNVRGWTPDGRVIFASGRHNAPRGNPTLFTIGSSDAMPQPMPLPRAFDGSVASDGRTLAYELVARWDPEWRGYRGGQTQPIRLLDLETLEQTEIPWSGTVDVTPVWIGETVYFLSDRDDAANVWAYDTESGDLSQITRYADYDVKGLDSYDGANGGALVFEQAGRLHLYDPATEQTETLRISVRGDLPWTRAQWERVDGFAQNPALSPSGKRALFEARGEIFSVPVEEGDWRNLTGSPGAADRFPAWSPDGQHVAWFSDASGEYQLMLGDPLGLDAPRAIDLPAPSFYYNPTWSPDGERLVFTDADRNVLVMEVETGRTTRVDGDGYAHPERSLSPTWSPDGRYLAYAKRMDNQFRSVMVYDTETGTAHAISDGLSDAFAPAWDASGDYLYFAASTDLGVGSGWLDLSSLNARPTQSVYLATLHKDTPSPFLPRSDEEPMEESGDADEDGDEGDDEDEADDEERPIDFDGIQNRILALGLPEAPYVDLMAGAEGVLFVAESTDGGIQLHRYSLEEREAKPFLSGVSAATVSHDGSTLLAQAGGSWRAVSTAAPPSPGDGTLEMGLRARVEPGQEWAQMFAEAWRYQRDYFYAPNLHGADWDAVREMYEPWVEHVRHRSDFSYLIDVLGGETSVGHSFVGGGDFPDVDRVSVGLLGADFAEENGRYRITRIYTAESWNPDLSAPLAAPGVDVSVGDYLISVNGQPLTTATNLYRPFEGTAGRQTTLGVSDSPSGEVRRVTVVPVGSEMGLRRAAWVEDNRRYVDERSDGALAYVWVPDTGDGGFTYFNRYYFAQQDRDGAIIDERFNNGGFIAEYIIDVLARERFGYFNNPVGERTPWSAPLAGIWGPKVMLVNEMSGSGGDMLPYMFRARDLGQLVGTKTWGGLVGIWDVPPLIDGGTITAPRGGFFDLDGRWSVENEGVAPDVEVHITPADYAAGRKPQLDAAIEIALRELRENPVERLPEPPPPIRSIRPSGR